MKDSRARKKCPGEISMTLKSWDGVNVRFVRCKILQHLDAH